MQTRISLLEIAESFCNGGRPVLQLSSVRVGNWEEIKHWSEIRLAFVGMKRIFISGVITVFFKAKGAVVSGCLEREKEDS